MRESLTSPHPRHLFLLRSNHNINQKQNNFGVNFPSSENFVTLKSNDNSHYFVRVQQPYYFQILSQHFLCSVFPESLRWLVARSRLESAHAILMKYADKNSVTVDSETIMSMLEECKAASKRVASEVKRSPLNLVRTPRLRRRTVILCYNWFVL